MIVVDASALIEALLRTPAAKAVENRLFALGSDTACAAFT
jgi:predicted nucleic acid-binding protein